MNVRNLLSIEEGASYSIPEHLIDADDVTIECQHIGDEPSEDRSDPIRVRDAATARSFAAALLQAADLLDEAKRLEAESRAS